MVTHMALDHDLIGETIAGIRSHWQGLFAFGAPDRVVVNVTKDAIWNRGAALPESGSMRKPTRPAEIRCWLGGSVPVTLEVPAPKYSFSELTTKETLSHEISPAVYAPADVQRPLARDFPSSLAGRKIPAALVLGSRQIADAVAELNRALRDLAGGTSLAMSGAVGRAMPGHIGAVLRDRCDAHPQPSPGRRGSPWPWLRPAGTQPSRVGSAPGAAAGH
jgi:hypothetical protein